MGSSGPEDCERNPELRKMCNPQGNSISRATGKQGKSDRQRRGQIRRG